MEAFTSERDWLYPVDIAFACSGVLCKVAQWLRRYKDVVEAEETVDEDFDDALDMEIDMAAWDEEFFRMDPKRLANVLMAANFMEIPSLVDKAYEATAEILKGKTSDEVQVLLEQYPLVQQDEDS